MDIYWDDGGQLLPAQLKLLKKVAEATAEHCSFTEKCEAGISFITAEEIRVLNRDYRGKDIATDVLSFPVSQGLVMGPGISLGDIAICIEIARQQAVEYNHSLERELAFLVVHGMLHLLGYDHETPEDESEMCATQEAILGRLNINR